MKRLAARRYAGLLILSPTAAADPDNQPADCSQVNILLHVFSSQAQDSARVHRMGREEEMDKMCVYVCVCAHAKERERVYACVRKRQGERVCRCVL